MQEIANECKKIAFESDDNILITTIKIIPRGFQNIAETIGFDGCSDAPTFFEHMVNSIEPVISFILLFVGGI